MTASTPSPVSYQGEEESGRMESTTTPDCSLINNEQSTLVPETDDSLYVNTGYSGDVERHSVKRLLLREITQMQ